MTEFTELLPGLPDDISLECLTRCHHSTHRVAARVNRRWRNLFQGRDFYNTRKVLGRTRKLACLVQLIQPATSSTTKSASPPSYGISVYDPDSESWERVEPVPGYPNGAPLFCQVASCEGKLVVMGGWDPASYEPVRHVYVYDFSTQAWRVGKEMPAARSFFAAAGMGGNVYVAGGHDEGKNALRSAWVYNLGRDEWAELGPMGLERDECEGVVVGSHFWVVSGYQTETQGAFVSSAECYDVQSGAWKRVEGAWKELRCPRANVGVGKGGDLFSWVDVDPAVRVGACGVDLGGGRTFVSGSDCQGGSQEFFMVQGQNSKLRKISVPDGFLGFAQSGCCVEV